MDQGFYPYPDILETSSTKTGLYVLVYSFHSRLGIARPLDNQSKHCCPGGHIQGGLAFMRERGWNLSTLLKLLILEMSSSRKRE